MPSNNNDESSGSSASAMGFPQYCELPLELRLRMVEEFISIPDKRRTSLAPFAGVHSEWSTVIERILFSDINIKNGEAKEFGRICSRRQDRLDQVTLGLHLQLRGSEDNDLVLNQATIQRNVSELFHVMKDWECLEGPHRLITLTISLPDRRNWWVNGRMNVRDIKSLACDFADLPEVPIIGRLFTKDPSDGFHFIQHSTLDVLYKKLPNLSGASLGVPSDMLVQETVDVANSRMIATHDTKPDLSTLSITQNPSSAPDFGSSDFVVRNRKDEMEIARSLTPTVSLWASTLVSLRIDCIIDIPQFLSAASSFMWPNLKTIQVAAILDKDEGEMAPGSRGGLDPEKEYRAPAEVLQGLIAALPAMRNLTNFDVQFRDPTTGFWACCLCMDLNARPNTNRLICHPATSTIQDYRARHSAVVPCECGSLLTEGGTLVTRNVVLPGDLVTVFQNTVWQLRYQRPAVWCCRISVLKWGMAVHPVLPCTRWNKEAGCWDFAFLNDMDVLIWQMGRFFTDMQTWDYRKEHNPAVFRSMLDADFAEDFGQ